MTLNFPSDPGAQTPVNTYGPDSTPLSTDNGVLYTWDGDKWVANKQISYDGRYVNVTGDTMTGDLTVPSLNGGPLAGFRNQIINGDFRIWQRGNTRTYQESTFVVYSSDRWANYKGNSTGTCTTTKVAVSDIPGFSTALQMTGSGASYTQTCYQPIELDSGSIAPFGVGQTWTLSCYVKGSAAGSSELFAQYNDSSDLTAGLQSIKSEAINFTTSWQRFTLTFTIPAATGSPSVMNVGLYDPNGTVSTNVLVTGFQLEPGSVATPFEHRPNELALCQRYYFTIRGNLFTKFGAIYTNNDGASYLSVVLPVTMRALPDVTFNDIALVRSGQNISTGDIDTVNFAGTHISIDFSSSYGIPNESSDFAQLRESNATFNLEAEL